MAGVRLTASWNEPEQKNGILNGYSLVWTDSQGVSKAQSFDNATLSYTISDLERCEAYTVVVRADTVTAGFGPDSNERMANITNSGTVCYLFLVYPLSFRILYGESITVYGSIKKVPVLIYIVLEVAGIVTQT